MPTWTEGQAREIERNFVREKAGAPRIRPNSTAAKEGRNRRLFAQFQFGRKRCYYLCPRLTF